MHDRNKFPILVQSISVIASFLSQPLLFNVVNKEQLTKTDTFPFNFVTSKGKNNKLIFLITFIAWFQIKFCLDIKLINNFETRKLC